MSNATLQVRRLGKGKYKLKVKSSGVNESQVVNRKDLSKRITDRADKASGKYIRI